MDNFGLPDKQYYQRIFNGLGVTSASSWQVFQVPKNKAMLHIYMVGSGGGGGAGAIGAVSNGAGGGGGGSGGQTIIEIPTALLPDRLYISVPMGKTGTGLSSYVSTLPTTSTSNHVVGIANGGAVGGNGTGGTAGTAGGAGAIATSATMPLGWPFAKLALAGQAGTVGGGTSSATSLAHPTTGLRVTGGTGGGGLPASGGGANAGGINAVANPSYFLGVEAGTGSTLSTTPPNNGNNGKQYFEAGLYFTGATGGGATHTAATGAGLVQSYGGDGNIGSGGGGSGGALTGSTPAPQSKGGSGLVIITAW